jgi:hypothetical protein
MQRVPAKAFSKVGFSFAAGLFWALSAAQAFPQDLVQVYAIPELKTPVHQAGNAPEAVGLSASQKAVMENDILAAARRYWKDQGEDCDPQDRTGGFTIRNGSEGSFTRLHAKQKAVLYQYCMTGHNFADNGIVVFEGDRVAAHIVYKGAWDHGLLSLPDLDGSGQSPILIVSGGTNMGETWQAVSIIELSEKGVKTFGHTETYRDDCGSTETAGPDDQPTTYKLFAKKGTSPVFYRESFAGDCAQPVKWAKSGALEQITLDDAGKSGIYIRLK